MKLIQSVLVPLDAVKRRTFASRTVLNNTTSQNPRALGGPTCSSLATSMTSANNVVTLRLPNSFRADDGLALDVVVRGRTLAEIERTVCAAAFATLLLRDPN